MFQLTLGPGLRGGPASTGPGYATVDFDKGVVSGVPQLVLAKETKSGTPMNVVELSVKCKNLLDRDVASRSDPMCVFYLSEDGEKGPWKFVGRSERVMNTLNPEFLTKFKVSYFFEQVQFVKFELYDVDNDYAKYSKHDFLGSSVMTLGEIVGAFGSTVHKKMTMGDDWPYKNHGSIIVAAHEVSEKSQPVLLQFRAQKLDRKDFLGKSDPFFQFYRVNDDTSRTLLHRSEVVENELSPVWKPFKVQMNQIADNKKRILEVVCLDYDQDGRHDIIGCFQTTFEKLNCGPGPENVYEAINGKKVGKKGYKNSGTFELSRITNIFPANSFLDYIRGGTQIHFTVAVDFSRPRNSRDSVANPHRLRPSENEFQMALKAVGEIVQDYDSDKLFPALACGAKIPPHMLDSHDFSLNFQADSQCHGVDGLVEAYQRAAHVVQPTSSARFSNIITQVSKLAQASAETKTGMDYFILLILTSGAINDVRQTITAIIDASSLPLSIVIVGVGKNDFDTMERLDSDRKKLSIDKKKAERDIVQFVQFDKIKKKGSTNATVAQAKLAREVLREVPKQLTSWMLKNHIAPRPPIQVDGDRLPIGPSSTDHSSENVRPTAPAQRKHSASDCSYRSPSHHDTHADKSRSQEVGLRRENHSASVKETRTHSAIRPSAPPVELDEQYHQRVPMNMAGPENRFPSDRNQRSPASSFSPCASAANEPAGPAHGRFISHAIPSSARYGDPLAARFHGPPTMQYGGPYNARYGTPPMARATDFAVRPYDPAPVPYRHRSHSARDHYRNNPKDPFAGHYY